MDWNTKQFVITKSWRKRILDLSLFVLVALKNVHLKSQPNKATKYLFDFCYIDMYYWVSFQIFFLFPFCFFLFSVFFKDSETDMSCDTDI